MPRHNFFSVADPVKIFRTSCDDLAQSQIYQSQGKTVWIVLDESLGANPAVQSIMRVVESPDQQTILSFVPKDKVRADSLLFYGLAKQALQAFQGAPDVLVVIGDRKVLELGTFLAASLYHDDVAIPASGSYVRPLQGKGIDRFIVMPTAQEALDVAYKGQGRIHTHKPGRHPHDDFVMAALRSTPEKTGRDRQKSGSWELYRRPDEIVIDPAFIRTPLPVVVHGSLDGRADMAQKLKIF